VIDKRDWVWHGGSYGLDMFDGTKWTSFTERGRLPKVHQAVLPQEYIEAAGIDSEGNPWFGLYARGVATFDGTEWRFFSTRDGLASGSVWGVFGARDGAIWFGTFGGITRYRSGGRS
jgi:ligand-binding sensor domain-containing protein